MEKLSRREFLRKLLKGTALALGLGGGLGIEGKTLLERHSKEFMNLEPSDVVLKVLSHKGKNIALLGVTHECDWARDALEFIKRLQKEGIIDEDKIVSECNLDKDLRMYHGSKYIIFDPKDHPVRIFAETQAFRVPAYSALFSLLGTGGFFRRLFGRKGLRRSAREVKDYFKAAGLLAAYWFGSLHGTTFPDPLLRGRELLAYKKINELLEKGEINKGIAVVTGKRHVPGIIRVFKDPLYRRILERVYSPSSTVRSIQHRG